MVKSLVRNLPVAHRGLWFACFAILIAILLSSPSHAQQNDVPETPQSSTQCKLEHQSCGCITCGCNTCGSCGSGTSCPSGYTVYDDYCLPECPTGYLRYPGYPGYCMPPCHHGCPEGFEPVPLPNCPDGYYRNLRNPEECLPERTSYPDNCPEGLSYSQETGRCSPVCPDGTYLGENGLCQSYYGRECPEGYSRNPQTGACVPPGDWPDDYRWVCMPVCPQGFTRDIYHPTRCVPPPDDCPQGYENFRNQCVPVCEQGTTRNSYGYCVPPRCEDGSYPDLRGNCRKPECPEGYDNIQGLCYPPCTQGFQRSSRDPADCERIPQDEPDCPEGTKLNVQTGNCDRFPPPVKCKQGLDYNPKTKRCEPPQRTEKVCPKGFTKTQSGKCQPIEKTPPRQPECRKNFFLNKNTGECEPITLKLPRACPEGTAFSRKRQRCVPVFNQQKPEFEPEPDDELESQPPVLRLNRNIFKLPRLENKCPEGTAPDKNGRCMLIQ